MKNKNDIKLSLPYIREIQNIAEVKELAISKKS